MMPTKRLGGAGTPRGTQELTGPGAAQPTRYRPDPGRISRSTAQAETPEKKKRVGRKKQKAGGDTNPFLPGESWAQRRIREAGRGTFSYGNKADAKPQAKRQLKIGPVRSDNPAPAKPSNFGPGTGPRPRLGSAALQQQQGQARPKTPMAEAPKPAKTMNFTQGSTIKAQPKPVAMAPRPSAIKPLQQPNLMANASQRMQQQKLKIG